MNRFIPDSLLDALLRPLAMAAPNGWIYTEVMAPDLRFVFMALLVVACILTAWKRKALQPALPALAALLVVSFGPWLATSGNGRYFIPMLVLVGILSVGLAHALPFTRSMRASVAVLMVLVQGFAVLQNNPWNSWNPWGVYDWKEAPYYPLMLDAEARQQPATYVTLAVQTFSLIAPQFPPESHWLNLSVLLGDDEASPAMQRANRMLASAERLRVVLPSGILPAKADGQPRDAVLLGIEKVMLQQHLKLAEGPNRCRLLPLRPDPDHAAAAAAPQGKTGEAAGQHATPQGFWICQAVYVDAPPAPPEHLDAREAEVFAVLERSCPRLFPPGLTQPVRIARGAMRHYGSADMKVYVLDDGTVYYKYHRALNPELVGRVDEVLAKGFSMPCDQVRGRAGMPWDRDS